jgi:hypothetical protein
MKPDLYGASLSDVHLGHPKTPTDHIITNLRRAFPDVDSTHKLDVIFFGGDLFDRLLSLNQFDVPMILEWGGNLFRMAETHQIHIVFMEGTPSHDWRQQRLLEVLKKLGMGGKFVHFIEELSIVHFEDLDINVLFVPDEWRPEPDDTWMEVRELLREKNLEQVDFTLLHGAFDYQLPEHVKVPKHVTERYQQITKYAVFGAHIHSSTVRGNVYVNGSFDRLSHNEEEEKGHWRFKFKPGKEYPELKFVVNQHAKVYKTVDCTGLDLDEALDRLAIIVGLQPEDSHLRVKAPKAHPILTSFDVLRKRHPQINWSSKVTEDDNEVQKNLLVDVRSSFTQIQITPENIVELLTEKLKGLTSDPAVLQRCATRIKELI